MATTVKVVLAYVLVIVWFSVPASAFPFFPSSTASTNLLTVGFRCGLVNGKLVCGDKQGGGKQRSDNDDDDRSKKSKDKVIPETCGKKVNCDVGYIKLAKPNKYGACCEPREGLPPPKSTEAPKPIRICCKAVHAPTGGGATYAGTARLMLVGLLLAPALMASPRRA